MLSVPQPVAMQARSSKKNSGVLSDDDRRQLRKAALREARADLTAQLKLLVRSEYQPIVEQIDSAFARKAVEIEDLENIACAGMPMSGIIWDRIEQRTNQERLRANRQKLVAWSRLNKKASDVWEWWAREGLTGPGEPSRLEQSLAIGSPLWGGSCSLAA